MTKSAHDSLREDVGEVARRVAERLAEISGVGGVALGGSWSRGAGASGSDVDIGIYYAHAEPPAVADLRRVASELHGGGSPPIVTDFGEWGPWVNGGAWLKVGDHDVDWLYRDLERVSATIGDCVDGRPTCDYYLGHPHGFHNHVYLAEVHYCRPLFDPNGVLQRLKERVQVYPPKLKEALIRKYSYDARFMLDLARKPARRGDVFHVCGCLFRCAAALTQVLFALNERYFMNEKGALVTTDEFPVRPPAFSGRISAILARPGESPESLLHSLDAVEALLEETLEACPEGTP